MSQTNTKKGDVVGFGIAAWHALSGWQHGEALFPSLKEVRQAVEAEREGLSAAVTEGGFDVVITKVYAFEPVEAIET